MTPVGLAPKDNVRHDQFRFFDLLQIEVTRRLELYLSPFFHKGKNMEELTTNTEVSKVSLKMQFYRVQRLQNKPNTCILKLLLVVLVIKRVSSRSPAGFFLP